MDEGVAFELTPNPPNRVFATGTRSRHQETPLLADRPPAGHADRGVGLAADARLDLVGAAIDSRLNPAGRRRHGYWPSWADVKRQPGALPTTSVMVRFVGGTRSVDVQTGVEAILRGPKPAPV